MGKGGVGSNHLQKQVDLPETRARLRVPFLKTGLEGTSGRNHLGGTIASPHFLSKMNCWTR